MTVHKLPNLPLKAANAFQLTNEGLKEDWAIRENETNNVLCRVPSSVQDGPMFTILEFLRETELNAFNEGIKFQKDKQNSVLVAEIEKLKEINQLLKEENERLVTVLNVHLPDEE